MPVTKIMKQKFIQEFFEADEVNKLMIKRQLELAPGVTMLVEMIKKVRDDISTLDEDAYKIVEKGIHALSIEYKKKKEDVIAKTPEPEDSVEKSQLDYKLLNIDRLKYARELLLIQNLAAKKGWFD